MSVLRQLNVLGQQRLDVPHIRSIESSIAADFDVVAGRVQAGGKAVVVRGFTLANYTTGTNATAVQLSTADGIVYNMNSSESGTFLWVPADRAVEVLNSATNSRVQGGFTAGQTNYVGLDLVRSADDSTSDLVQFLDPNTLLEQPKSVPLARTLDYKIVISTTPFSASPNIIPIAKIITDTQNQISSASNAVQDARNGFFRLGSGGDFPNTYNGFTWPQNRLEYDPNVSALSGLDHFVGGDKGLKSQKDWQDAVMTRIWEMGGGQNWYSPTADRNAKMTKNPASTFVSNADNFEWGAEGGVLALGLYGVNHLHWQGLKIVFENANVPGVYYNIIADQISDDPAGSAATSKTALAIGDCIYVDVDRTQVATIVARKAAIQSLGSPTIPGSRFILAWRDASGFVFTREAQYAVNQSFAAATTVAIGAVRLAYVAGTPGTPTVNPLDANNSITIGGVTYPIVGNNVGLTVTGGGTAAGASFIGGSTSGAGLAAQGVTSGAGGTFTGGTSGRGINATSQGAATAGFFTAGATGKGIEVTTTNNDGVSVAVGGNNKALVLTGTSTSQLASVINSGTGAAITATGGSGVSGGLGIGGDFTGGGQYAVRATATAGLIAAHAILAQGSNSGGSYGVKAFGGDINASTSTDDTTFNVGYGCGLLGIAGQSFGGVGVAGYGGGTSVSHSPAANVPDGQGGYFIGVASASFNSADGLFARGGAATGANSAGNGANLVGGASVTANGGFGARGQGGAASGAGNGGTGLLGLGGTGTIGGTGVRGIGGASGTGGLGVQGDGGGTAGIGVRGTGAGTGAGVIGLSSSAGAAAAVSNVGVYGKGTNVAVYGDGNTNGQGGLFQGAGTGKGAEISSFTGALALDIFSRDGATNRQLVNATGYIGVNSTTPAANVGMSNMIANSNIIKLWADITMPTSNGACTVNDGFNISGATTNSTNITVSFATAMANSTYAVNITNVDLGASTSYYWYVTSRSTTQFVIAAKFWNGTAVANAPLGVGSGTTLRFTLQVVGAQ